MSSQLLEKLHKKKQGWKSPASGERIDTEIVK